jgi:DNA polymerase-3 subunit alpha
MASIANINGFYYVPRIDKNIVEKYKEYIMVLWGTYMVRFRVRFWNLGENQTEEALVWNNNLDWLLSRSMRHTIKRMKIELTNLIEFAQNMS